MSYIDSRGVPMDDMTFSAALERVHALAGTNLPDGHDIARDDALADERTWQQAALRTVEDFIVEHHEDLDREFAPPAEYGEWPAEAVQPDRSDDPDNVVYAIRIVLQMARNAQPDAMTVSGVEEADRYDQDNQALELTEDLVALHGEDLDAKVRLIRLPTAH